MIEDKELQALVEFGGEREVLSVYLDTDLSYQSKDAVKLKFRERTKGLAGSAQDDITKIEAFLDFEYDWLTRAVAIFAADDDLWKVIPLPISVATQSHYTERPYVRVLMDVLDRFGSFGVAVLDRESLRLFSIDWGGIRAETESVGEELKRHKQGGWAAARYQRHEDNLALLNLKQAAEVVQAFCETSGCKRLMLGGSSGVLAQFKELLSKPVRDHVIGEFAVDMTASTKEIQVRALDVAGRVDLAEEQRLVEQAITAAAKGGAGVTGLVDTLYNLQQGRVQVLLANEAYQSAGHVCGDCGYVFAEAAAVCPLCQGENIISSSDIVNVAIHKAVQTGADVNIVRSNEQLSGAGGIAALLRY